MLLAAATLAVYKPAGVTRDGTPRWAKVFGVIVIALVLLLGAMMLGGGHGPGAHASDG